MSLRICVCVKVVPRAAVQSRIDPITFRLDRSGPTEINTPDLYALEEALQLRDCLGGEVIVIASTPADGQECLRAALAMGADRAVVVSDSAIAGSDLLGTCRVLAAAIRREAADLALFGALTLDGGGGQVWAAVGELLEQPVVSGLRRLGVSDGVLQGERQVVGGDQRVEAPLPCVASLAGSAHTPRYPSFRDIVTAKKKVIEAVTLADLGLGADDVGAAAAGSEVLALAAPPPRQNAGEVFEDNGRGATWLAEFITSRGLA